FRQILVELQGTRERPGDLRDLDRMGQARAVMIAVGGDEDVGLVLEPAKGGGMDDAVAIALEVGTGGACPFGDEPPPACPGVRCEGRPLAGAEAKGIKVDCHSFTAFAPPIDAALMPSYL